MGEFCYWDAKSLGDTIIMAVLLLIQAIIGLVACRRLIRGRRMGDYSKKIVVVYTLIIAWAVAICFHGIYSITIFFTYLFNNPTESMVPFSRNYARYNVLPGFLVQTIFLTICRYYYIGFTGAIKVHHLCRWERNYINYLNVYYYVRIGAQTIGVILVNIYAQTDHVSFFFQISVWILITDSVIMNIYLILSLKIYLKAIRFIPAMSEKEIQTLKVEYGLMIATSLMRVIIDLIFLAIPLF